MNPACKFLTFLAILHQQHEASSDIHHHLELPRSLESSRPKSAWELCKASRTNSLFISDWSPTAAAPPSGLRKAFTVILGQNSESNPAP